MKKMLIGTLLVAVALSGWVQAVAGGVGKSAKGSSDPSPKSGGQKPQNAPNPPRNKVNASVPNDTYNNGLTPLRGADWKDPGTLYPGGSFFRWVAAGDFKMGSPEGESGRSSNESLKDVKISDPFWICDHEVTLEEFEGVREYNPFKQSNEQKQEPVVALIWKEAVQYCNTLTEKYQALKLILPSQEFRLPTSAEWEFAARARGAETGPWYGGGDLGDYAWFDGNGRKIKPVKTRKPNGLNLYDMLGNAAEYTQDGGPDRPVVRGGSAFDSKNGCRLASKSDVIIRDYYFEISDRQRYDCDSVGFRVVLAYKK